jgi:hypothetical protein
LNESAAAGLVRMFQKARMAFERMIVSELLQKKEGKAQ